MLILIDLFSQTKLKKNMHIYRAIYDDMVSKGRSIYLLKVSNLQLGSDFSLKNIFNFVMLPDQPIDFQVVVVIMSHPVSNAAFLKFKV